MIRVGFDISQLAHTGGVVTYTDNVTAQLSKLSDLEMVYFYSSLRKPYKGKLKNVKAYRLPPTLFETLFNKIRNIGIEKFIGPVDIFHSSDWVQPPSKALKVTTYHDVVPIKYPQWSHPDIISVHKKRLEIVEKEIDHVVAVSESTKKDLIEISSIPEQKITVIYEGPSKDFQKQPEEKIKTFKTKYNLPDEFILAIGGIGERRNLKNIRKACEGYNLIVTGEDIPWLDLNELELLYQSAQVLLYPSFYEGFGIPILDAFACDLPVITSNVSSMPEVGGNGALYVDPLNIKDIKDQLEKVLNDEQLRKEMVQKGSAQLKQFSWEKTAEETAKLYRRLMNK